MQRLTTTCSPSFDTSNSHIFFSLLKSEKGFNTFYLEYAFILTCVLNRFSTFLNSEPKILSIQGNFLYQKYIYIYISPYTINKYVYNTYGASTAHNYLPIPYEILPMPAQTDMCCKGILLWQKVPSHVCNQHLEPFRQPPLLRASFLITIGILLDWQGLPKIAFYLAF